MIKKWTKAGAFLLAAFVFAESTLTVFATEERSTTYNYDYWGDVQDSPDAYTTSKVYTSIDFGLDTPLKNPEGMFAIGNMVYICDTGNNRIIELLKTSGEVFEVQRIIDSFSGGAGVNTFQTPTDIAVSEEGELYIADKGNGRIVKLDKDLNYLMEFVKPVDATIDPSATYLPSKIAIDTAGRVYCVASGINKGLVKYESDGTFSGFVGAMPASYNWMDYIWKKFATQAQRAQMESFVPTEYDNLYMDYEGFIYTVKGLTTSNDDNTQGADKEKSAEDAVRKLNLLGSDILVRNGEYPVYGDLYWGEGGGFKGPSYFTDITVMDNDIYVCLDKNRGRLFGYNDQGRLVYVFGGNGNMDGYFRSPTAIEHVGQDLLVLDSIDCSVTLFTVTEFGSLIYQAMDQFDQGQYTEAGETWQKVMNINGNYDLAYIGIGRSLLRQKRYHEAMEYFELKYDDENYSKAFKQYRKEWVEDHIVIIILILLLVIVVPLIVGKIKAIKHEIDIADIFRT